MNYTVNLGCWNSIFAIPTDIVDKYLKIAGSAQLKVLLYILRHSGSKFELNDIADYLNMSTFDVKDCIEFWVSFNVISVNNNIISPAAFNSNVKQSEPQNTPAPVVPVVPNESNNNNSQTVHNNNINISNSPKEPEVKKDEPQTAVKTYEKPSDTVVSRPLRPDPIYVAKRISEDKEIEALLNEAQYILGRPVSPNENAGMIMLHDNEGLPCEVILMLLTYGVSAKKGMRQIEAMGAAWAKEGIRTVEQADNKISQLDEINESCRKVFSILHFEQRTPSDKEEKIYTRWIKEWKFSDEMIKEAYDICINSKGKYIINYVNTILQRWYESGIRTVEQVHAQRPSNNAKKNNGNNDGSGNNSSFDISDLNGLSMFND
ncbi:MAG: DnaD domain protein [Clostridia bacterium]|nr:DnaD domain protein [Clostridia bacterium]